MSVHRLPLVDRPLRRADATVPLSGFSHLFCALVQYHQSRSASIEALEASLEAAGREVGIRSLELLVARERGSRRETRLQGALQFIHTNVWRFLFGRVRRDRPGVG